MKRLDILKTIQLIVFSILTVFCVYTVMSNEEIYKAIANIPEIGIIAGMLWVTLGISFLFLFIDFSFFSSFKQDYKELSAAALSDPHTGIANRISCDALIEKYIDMPLPDTIGCVMFELTNIQETNTLYGHTYGNISIRDFSLILKTSSIDLCFIGRNGGNKFIALFEDCSDAKIETFLKRVHAKIDSYNSTSETYPISYKFGIAFHEDKQVASKITDLIALANARINNC